MKLISAKQFLNETEKVLHEVAGGERVLITKRGKSWVLLSPAVPRQLKPVGLRDYQEAWDDIEKTMLCGAWVDSRTADEILADIRANRNWFTRERRKNSQPSRRQLKPQK